eukprot:872856-Amphidinium_carterae.1
MMSGMVIRLHPPPHCRYWLPEKIFLTKQNINDLIAGPGGPQPTCAKKMAAHATKLLGCLSGL